MGQFSQRLLSHSLLRSTAGFRLSLHFFQISVAPDKFLLPVLVERFGPVRDILERYRDESPRPPLR
jgi:hypothetical protein